MVESADTRDLKSLGSNAVPVQVRSPAPKKKAVNPSIYAGLRLFFLHFVRVNTTLFTFYHVFALDERFKKLVDFIRCPVVLSLDGVAAHADSAFLCRPAPCGAAFLRGQPNVSRESDTTLTFEKNLGFLRFFARNFSKASVLSPSRGAAFRRPAHPRREYRFRKDIPEQCQYSHCPKPSHRSQYKHL